MIFSRGAEGGTELGSVIAGQRTAAGELGSGGQPARTSWTLSPTADPSVEPGSLAALKGEGTWLPSGGVEGGSLQS